MVDDRFLLGCAEAGFFPGIVYYFTLWYRPHERATRLALFYSASAVAGAFGGVLAYAILSSMEGVAGLHDYQWVFILEGAPDESFMKVSHLHRIAVGGFCVCDVVVFAQ
jgi:MFS family permease